MKQQVEEASFSRWRCALESAGPWGETLRPRLELLEGGGLTIWRPGGLLEYSDTRVRVEVGPTVYTVEGTGLTIAAMSGDRLTVRGAFHAVRLEARP